VELSCTICTYLNEYVPMRQLSQTKSHRNGETNLPCRVRGWLSRDPLPNAEGTQGANLYWYVGNNAINAVDPLGLLPPGVPPVSDPSRQSPDPTPPSPNNQSGGAGAGAGAAAAGQLAYSELIKLLTECPGNNKCLEDCCSCCASYASKALAAAGIASILTIAACNAGDAVPIVALLCIAAAVENYREEANTVQQDLLTCKNGCSGKYSNSGATSCS
jgi:RHS repeat-associated protein